MRDILIVLIVGLAGLAALRRPWIGVMLWTWLSIMNPHRYAYGFANGAPLAMIAALCTLIGIVATRDKRELPFKGSPVTLLVLFMAWMTASWYFGLDRAGDHEQWDKVMKIDVMLLVSLALLHTKQHIFALMWVCAGSLALLGAKGGVFTVLTAGAHRVWGPDGSFIQDNNHFALALIMTIPLLRFLQMQLVNKWGRRTMAAVMVLVAAAALGSHSRGALLALSAMALFLWWKGGSRAVGAVVIAAVGVALVMFMPDQWFDRMSTIESYEQDPSAMGRISAWWVAWNIALNYPLGVGFEAARPELFAIYSPYPEIGVFAAHSIYFQILGHHGFVGLALWLAIWITTWVVANQIKREAEPFAEARWCIDLANMCQVSLLGYAVGGTFLSLAYFDLPYNIMAMVVLTRLWIRRRSWEHEPEAVLFRRFTLPGLAMRPRAP